MATISAPLGPAPESQSPLSTVPDTPSAAAPDDRDFARLIPSNAAAKAAFSGVVEKVLRADPAYDSAQDSIHFEKDTEFGSDVSSFDEGEPPKDALRQFKGYYRLNLAMPFVDGKWSLGSESSKDGPLMKMRFILCVKSDTRRYRVSKAHGLFKLNDSGILTVTAFRERHVTLRTGYAVERLLDRERPLIANNTTVEFGNLSYEVKYNAAVLDDPQYREDLIRVMQIKTGMPFDLPDSLITIGTADQMQYKHYYIQKGFASGSDGVVYSAIHASKGNVLAAKRVRATHGNFGESLAEIKILKQLQIGEKSANILRYVEHFEDGAGPTRDVLIFFEPLLLCTWHGLRGRQTTFQDRTTLFAQSADALAWLHERNLMHRDLKPDNIGVKTLSPPTSVIIDFGRAEFATESNDHMVGTLLYLAPEVLNLKCGPQPPRRYFGQPADVWALGIAALELFMEQFWGGILLGKNERKQVVSWSWAKQLIVPRNIKIMLIPAVWQAIEAMIVEQPSQRMTAAQAAGRLRAVWQAATPKEQPNAPTGSKRALPGSQD